MRVTQYLLICIVIIAMLTGIVSAAPPNPNYVSPPDVPVPEMNGWPHNEWNFYPDGPDFWGTMYNGAANVYVRYDCDTNTGYVLVMGDDYQGAPELQEDGILASIDGINAFTSNSGNDGIPPDIVWGYASYEASFTKAPGVYNHFVINSLFYDSISSDLQTGTIDSPLTITCGEIPAPEFPSNLLPITMIIGFLGAVLLIQRTREQ